MDRLIRDLKALAVIAIVLFAIRAIQRWFERRKQSWPVATGKVATTYVITEMEKYPHETGEVCYSYDVNGKHYYGVQKIFQVDFDAYPAGSRILVHYKPSDPSVSRLDVDNMHAREEALD